MHNQHINECYNSQSVFMFSSFCLLRCVKQNIKPYSTNDRAPLTVYWIVLLIVSLPSPTGCVPIDFN